MKSLLKLLTRTRIFIIGISCALWMMPGEAFAQRRAAKQQKKPNMTVVDGKGTYYVVADGRMTASGERYYKAKYTCAHRTLPFGTHLKVTNLKNQRSVVVKVTDRGPYGRGFVVDLSYAGAEAINILRAGTVPVHLDVVSDSVPLGPVEEE